MYAAMALQRAMLLADNHRVVLQVQAGQREVNEKGLNKSTRFSLQDTISCCYFQQQLLQHILRNTADREQPVVLSCYVRGGLS
jgi:hypothetical protein